MRLSPTVRSVHGGVENLLIAKCPKKIQFSDMKMLKNKIYLSKDGNTFYSGMI
jgi:hypothetical protein